MSGGKSSDLCNKKIIFKKKNTFPKGLFYFVLSVQQQQRALLRFLQGLKNNKKRLQPRLQSCVLCSHEVVSFDE